MAVTNSVFVPTSGALGILAEGTVITSATQELEPGEVSLVGLIGADGVTITRDVSKEQIRTFNYGAVAREVVTESTLTITIPLLEDNATTRKLFFGTEEQDGKISWDLSRLTGGAVVFDVFDQNFGAVSGGTARQTERWVLPAATIEGTGDLSYVFGEARTFELTITAQVDPLTGVSAEIFRSMEEAPVTPVVPEG